MIFHEEKEYGCQIDFKDKIVREQIAFSAVNGKASAYSRGEGIGYFKLESYV